MKKWTIVDDSYCAEEDMFESRDAAIGEAREQAKNDPNAIFYVVEVNTRVSCFVEEPVVSEIA